MSADALQLAQDRHREGRLAEAIEAYSSYLEDHPQRGDIWHLRALAEHQSGRLDASSESVSRALEASGEQPSTLLLAGMVLQDRGDLEGAERRYARAAELRPGWAAPLTNRGQVLMDLQRVPEALETLRAAVALDPSNARIWNNIGLALLTLDRIDEALKAFGHCLSLAPLATAHFNIARILNMRNDVARALEHAQAAVRSDPRFTEGHLILADLYRKRRDVEGMRRSFANAVRSNPRHARALNAQAEFLAESGSALEARDEYRRIWAANPGNLKAALGANLLLPQVYSGAADLQSWRDEYVEGLERLEAAAEAFRFATPREAMLQARWINFYLAYQGRDDLELQRRFGDFIHGVLARAFPEAMQPREPERGRAKLRVGFCSHFFFNCTAGRYFSSWITRLDRSRFESYVYYTNEWMADDTRAIAAAADVFRHLPGRSFDLVARHIIDDRLDALVFPELGMHGETFSLGSLRLAPVQVAGWGHPTTTGLVNVDYFASSAEMEPRDAQGQYRERLAMLPGLGTRYAMPAVEGAGERSEFLLPQDRTLYFVPQSIFKIHPDNDALFASVMQADPRGSLVLYASQHEALNAAFRSRMAAAFEARGLRFEDRAIFLKYMTHAEYLRVNACCDVMLDTLHWSGGNTSLDAIASRLPLVTLPGPLMRGRQSAAMLRMMGIEELIAKDGDDYIAKAVSAANDRELRATLSARMKAGHPGLFDRDEPVRALEAFVEKAIAKARGS